MKFVPSSTLGRVVLGAGIAVIGGLVAIIRFGKKYDNEPRQPHTYDYSERRAADKSASEAVGGDQATDTSSTETKPDTQA